MTPSQWIASNSLRMWLDAADERRMIGNHRAAIYLKTIGLIRHDRFIDGRPPPRP